MKNLRTVLALFAATFTTLSINAQEAEPQIDNGDFESWTGTSDHEPDNWNSFETAGGSIAEGMFSSFVVQQQVDKSTLTRPGSTGEYSAVIWARSVLGIATAQGNLTLGRVIAGSMTAADKANHNQSLTSNSDFSQELGALPDSIVAWVRFVPAAELEDYPYARISATVHDSYDYIEYGSSDVEDETNESHAVAHAAKNFTAAKSEDGTYEWQRIAIPFSTEGCTATSPDYIIVNFTTNATPGQGTGGDSLYIDDVELVYADEIQEEETDYAENIAESYYGPLTVTLNGTALPASTENVYIDKTGKNLIQLSLNNFKLYNGYNETTGVTDYMYIGNIVIDNIPLTSENGETISIAKDTTINITNGTDPENAIWMGPMLGEVPVSISGTVSSESLDVNIDITFSGMSINVTFDGAAGTYDYIKNVNIEDTEAYTIYDTKGNFMGTGKSSLKSMEKGLYILKKGDKGEKVYVK